MLNSNEGCCDIQERGDCSPYRIYSYGNGHFLWCSMYILN